MDDYRDLGIEENEMLYDLERGSELEDGEDIVMSRDDKKYSSRVVRDGS